jgi:hypothetical protein
VARRAKNLTAAIATTTESAGALAVACACVCACVFTMGCGGSVDVTRAYSPADAQRLDRAKLVPTAVVRGTTRIAVPPNARIDRDRVTLPRTTGEHVHKLAAGDVIETDDAGRIVAVRSGGTPPVVTRFVPGTASSPDGADDVRGQLAEKSETIALEPGDKIEMHGSFASEEPVPGGGVVETRRSTTALVSGIVLLGLSYAPSAYVGFTSSRGGDRALLVPVVGPWIDFAGRGKCVPPPGSEQLPIDPCIGETASRVGLVVSGIVQTVGGLLIAISLPSKTEVVYDRDRGVSRAATPPRIVFVPTATPYGAGAAAVGTF